MRKFLFLPVLFLLTGLSFAQKNTRQLIDASQISSVDIHTDEVYKISVSTSLSSQISIKTHSEGEYYNAIALITEINGNTLNISTEYPQRLTGGYDKLSAHKVFSLEIELVIPENLELSVKSNIASLEGNGKFESVFADLKQGYCKLIDFSGAAVINTYSGNIYIETFSGIIDAISRNGEVQIPDFLPGRQPLRLTSIDGDIMVRKN